jgi:hypothetical protein
VASDIAVVRCVFSDPELIYATADEYGEEIGREMSHCYECDGDDPCDKHLARMQDAWDNIAALAFGMMRVEFE